MDHESQWKTDVIININIISCSSHNSCVEVGVFLRPQNLTRALGERAPFVGCVHCQVCCLCQLGIFFLPRISSMCFSRLLTVAPRVPTTIGATLVVMFRILCISNLRSWWFAIFSLSLSTMCVQGHIIIWANRVNARCLALEYQYTPLLVFHVYRLFTTGFSCLCTVHHWFFMFIGCSPRVKIV